MLILVVTSYLLYAFSSALVLTSLIDAPKALLPGMSKC